MKKHNIIMLILINCICFLDFNQFSKGYSPPEFNNILIETDKSSYYLNENITINALWDINPGCDPFSIHVIINDSMNEIWQSEEYYNVYSFEGDWLIKMAEMNLDIENEAQNFTVMLKVIVHAESNKTIFVDYDWIDGDTREIKICERKIDYNIYNFTEKAIYGEDISFLVRFIDETGNKTDLVSQNKVLLNIFDELEECTFSRTYTIDEEGLIMIEIPASNNLTVGRNLFRFNFLDDKGIFNDLRFYANLTLTQRLLNFQVINFTEKAIYGEDISFLVRFIDETGNKTDLVSQNKVLLNIFDELEECTFSRTYTIDEEGLIMIEIPASNNLTVGRNLFRFNFLDDRGIFNRTYFEACLKIEKGRIFADIIETANLNENNTGLSEKTKISYNAHFYYQFNGKKADLKKKEIHVNIYKNEILLYNDTYISNDKGCIFINLTGNEIIQELEQCNLSIYFIFLGDKNLDNNTFFVIKDINGKEISDNNIMENIWPFYNSGLSFFLIINVSFSLGGISILLLMMNNKKMKKIFDLSFSY